MSTPNPSAEGGQEWPTDEPAATLEAWHLHPEQFRYPWQTDDPR